MNWGRHVAFSLYALAWIVGLRVCLDRLSDLKARYPYMEPGSDVFVLHQQYEFIACLSVGALALLFADMLVL